MAYNRTRWFDHATERPRTYTQVTNPDNSVTLNPAYGEVIQEGTPQSATNFNNIEDALQHLYVAYDMMTTIVQAQMRALTKRVAELEEEVTELTEGET